MPARTVVVTGANRGIGLATALELAAGGYRVVGTVRDEGKANALRAAAAERGLEVEAELLDVADAEATAEGFERIAARTDGGPWAVVNNAGLAQGGAVEDVDDALVRRQLEVNLVAPARIARLVLPAMRARGEGRIVNVSSIAGRLSIPLLGWYAASKHGIEALSDALRVEVAGFGVKVILIEPGSFGTNIWASGAESIPAVTDSPYARAYERARQLTARDDLMPDPVWVARAIRLALASPRPLPRYLVGADALAGVAAEALVPTAVTDWIKGVASGLEGLPRMPSLPSLPALPFLPRLLSRPGEDEPADQQ